MKHYPAILESLYDQTHCILPSKLREIEAFILAKAGGLDLGKTFDRKELPTEFYGCDGAAVSGEPLAQGQQFVAVLPIFGTMFQHGGLSMAASGGTSTESVAEKFRQLDSNEAVKTIVLHTHSPGGQIWGTTELADLIYEARERSETRIVTAVNSQAASAAVWVSTAAHEVYVTPGGEMGSIGVLRIHEDTTQMEEAMGVKTTLIAVPEKKVEGWLTLDEETASTWRSEVATSYQKFLEAVARNRNVSASYVERNFGGGAMLRAEEAVESGLADGIKTIRQVVQDEVSKLEKRRPGTKSRTNSNRLALAESEFI